VLVEFCLKEGSRGGGLLGGGGGLVSFSVDKSSCGGAETGLAAAGAVGAGLLGTNCTPDGDVRGDVAPDSTGSYMWSSSWSGT
jgi:hypothetical protein